MTPALQLTDLCKSFGPTRIFDGVSLSVAPGERHAVIGPNGAGKSTLFHLISGRLSPSSGSIRLFGRDVAGAPPARIFASGLARNFQINSLFATLSARENLRCAALIETGHHRALWRRAAGIRDLADKVTEMLDRIGLGRRGDIPCDQLSYSEQRAIEIGMAAISGRQVVLLDEPTAGMNHAETDRFIDLIRGLTEGRTLMVVEHDMGVVFSLADRITVLAAGKVVASGAPDEIRGNNEVREAYLGQHAPAGKEGAEC
ncbi:ABC transporter ATP-binding protein [Acidimangrovimonas pyrenivorans]|uniref:ABC transporter ATP-binding protein n=1 Tax=Acidimangrovimonas pyrenivorans TaxID=2030798 RepID=A0ABV7ADN2_9RHOB